MYKVQQGVSGLLKMKQCYINGLTTAYGCHLSPGIIAENKPPVLLNDRENASKNNRLYKLQQGVSFLLRIKQCYINGLTKAHGCHMSPGL